MGRLCELKCLLFGHKLKPITEPGCQNIGYCVRKTRHLNAFFKLDPSKPFTFTEKGLVGGKEITAKWDDSLIE